MTATGAAETRDDSKLQRYYGSLESRIGYRLFLNGTRHFGFYDSAKSSPFSISKALRRMEDRLYDSLGLEKGAKALDAGCGIGHVAIHLANRGLKVHGIDIVKRHLVKARHNVKAAGLQSQIDLDAGDYHDLGIFKNDEFDGVYTMETFVHATHPSKALSEFFRVMKPGGKLALFEYDHPDVNKLPEDIRRKMKMVNEYSAMPANQMFDQGVLESLIEEAGFTDVKVEDISQNIMPMLWLFYVVAFIPYMIIRVLGLQKHFVNTMAGAEGYYGMKNGYARYIIVTAQKPGDQAKVAVPNKKTA